MKTLATAACLSFLCLGQALAYEERVERTPDHVCAAFFSPDSAGPAVDIPIPGNFYAFRGVFESKDLTCDEFLAKTKALISDWNKYPHMNFYALTFCRGGTDPKSSAEFIYAIDAWRPEAVAEVQAFLKDHRGTIFQGRTLAFPIVRRLDVKTVLALAVAGANGSLSPVHSADSWSSFSGTDQWYPANYERGKLIAQTDLAVFLDWVGRAYGEAEKKPFQDALAKANFVSFSDFFRLHLDDGQKAVFWLGFGGNRKCGSGPCFSAKPRPPLSIDVPAFRALFREPFAIAPAR